MKTLKKLGMSICFIGLATASFAHEYENKCQNIQVPVYDNNAVDDALAGAVIGGVLGKVVTKKDKGAAAGALIGGLIGAENSKKKVTGYRTEQKCEQIPLATHTHREQSWTNPDTKKPILIEQPRKPRETEEQKRNRERISDLQKSLNYFGFNVGSADGIMGSKTRKGIKEYQDYIGLNMSGVLSESDMKILNDCQKSSRASRESSLFEKRKTLQYCNRYESPKTSNDAPLADERTSLTNNQLETLWAIRNHQRMSSLTSTEVSQRVSAIDSIISMNPSSSQINKNKKMTISDIEESSFELPFKLDISKEINGDSKLIVKPYIDNIGDLYYSMDFLTEGKESVVFNMRLDSITSSESYQMVSTMDTFEKWSQTAKKNNLKQDISL